MQPGVLDVFCTLRGLPVTFVPFPLLPAGKNVLRKEPMSKEVEETDKFSFNEQFSSKLYKIKIGTVSAQKEGEVEKQETRHKVGTGNQPMQGGGLVGGGVAWQCSACWHGCNAADC